jgi:hypothetical protein
MTDQSSPLQFEDVPLDEARRMGRGPRMESMLYDTLRHKIQPLAGSAVRVRLGPEITMTRMKSYILRIARALDVLVTVRRVPGGVIFWRSTDEDIQQAQETGARLQKGQRRQTTRPRSRRPRGTH